MLKIKSKLFAGLMVGLFIFIGANIASAETINLPSTGVKKTSGVEIIKNLQMFLNWNLGTTITPLAVDGMWGPKTVKAIVAFQKANGLPATGNFLKMSAAKAAALQASGTTVSTGCPAGALFNPATGAPCGTTVATVSCPAGALFSPTTGEKCGSTVAATGPLAVSLAIDNPAAGNVLSSQALADLAHFTFTGTGTLSQVTLQRTGLSVSADVTNVYLFEGNTRLTDGASINTAGNIVFNNLNLAVNGSRTISVKVDIASSTSSVSLGVTLTGYMVTGSTTANTANVAGNLFYVSTAPTGGTTASLPTSNTVSTSNINAGTMNYTVWANSLQVSGRAAKLIGLNLHYIGSAPTDAVQNLKLYVDGTQVGSAVSISGTGYATFDFGTNPYTLSVSSHTVEVRGDIIKGSNRNFQFSLQNSSDLMITDSQIGMNVNATNAVANGAAGTITVNPGSVVVSQDPTFNTTTTITGGATNVTIAKYKLQAYGEDMKITSLRVTPAIASGHVVGAVSSTSLSNVGLYANGGQVGSSQNYPGSSYLAFSLGSSLIVPAGTTTILEVKADTINTSSINYIDGTLTTTLAADGSSNAQGMSSQNLSQVPGAGVPSNGIEIGSATATVAKSSSLQDKNVIANTAKTKIGSFIVQAGSSEGVRVSNIQIGLTLGTMTITNISNLYTSDDTNNIVGNPTTTNNFSVNYTIAPSTSRTIDVFADLGSAAAGTVSPTLKITAVGSSTNVSLTTGAGIASALSGQEMNVATGSLATPTLTTASLVSQFIAGGASPSLATYNFVATNGDATISELKFTIVTTPAAISQVCVGAVCAPVVGGVADVAGLAISVPAGYSGKDVVVTPTFNTVGIGGQTSDSAVTMNLTYMKYTIGNTTTPATPTVTGRAMRLVGSFPTVSVPATTRTGLSNTTVKLADVTVTADSHGAIKLQELPIYTSSTNVAEIASGTDNITVKDGSGNILNTSYGITNATFAVAAGGNSGDVSIVFGTPYNIPAGTSVTFGIYATASNVGGAVNTTSLSTKLGAASSFIFTDVMGNVADIAGSNGPIVNYPVEASVITN